jgi:hypothetical protein
MPQRRDGTSGTNLRLQRRLVVALAVMLGGVLLPTVAAYAGVSAGAGVSFPSSTTIGATGVPASITLTNVNTPPNSADTNTVCKAGDAAPPCSSPERGIVLVPSCGQLSADVCTAAGADPGVFQVSTASGRTGTACAGMTFTTTVIEPTFGTVRFTPSGGAHVTLAGTSAACSIDFTLSVLKSPTKDLDPATPGVQTGQTTEHLQFAGPSSPGAQSSFGRASAAGTTVQRATTTITTTATASVALGGAQMSDSATVSGRVAPEAGGATITFNVFAPSDTTCAGAAISTSVAASPVTNGPVASAGFTPTQLGTHRWIASYSGDSNNLPVSGACTDPNEQTEVTKANPTIATTASPTIALGAGSLTDSATVSGRFAPQSATVTFTLFGPNNATCTGTPILTSAKAYPVGGGAIASAPFTPTQPGTYRWIASYSGDANNNAVAGPCNAANESTVVTKAVPTITTAASANITLGAGATVRDTATVSGRVNPQAASITYRLFGPDDATCGGTPIFTTSKSYPVAGGPLLSNTFIPTMAGTYRWRATYNGDANNAVVAGACNDANESTVVAKAVTTIATTASPTSVELGRGSLTDTATVSGRVNPQAGATITFSLYGPDNATCTGAPAFNSTRASLIPDGPITSATFTPTATGVYRWRATYSGDANNAGVAGPCNAPNETTTVATPAASRYTAVSPLRRLDTRNLPTGPATPFNPGETRSLTVTGGTVPADITAVVVNMTAVGPSAGGFVTVFPTGVTKPLASNLNFAPGDVIANLVTVGVGTGGQIDIYNDTGTTNVIADVVGYYRLASGAPYFATTPTRLLDTRTGTGGSTSPWGPGELRTLTVVGSAVPDDASAVVVNMTVTQATAGSFLTVFPTDQSQPLASNLNFSAGQTIPNLVIVGVGVGGGNAGNISIFNAAGNVHILADVVGYYRPGTTGARFTPVTPTRLLDTRSTTPLNPFETRTLVVRGAPTAIPAAASSVVMNVTAVPPISGGFLTVFPAGIAQPLASNLNFGPNQVIPNLVMVGVGTAGANDHKVSFYNDTGTVNVIADVVGYMG